MPWTIDSLVIGSGSSVRGGCSSPNFPSGACDFPTSGVFVDLLLVGFVLGTDRGTVRLLRVLDGGEPQRMIAARQGVAGRCHLQLADPGDVARPDFGGRLPRPAPLCSH